MNYRKYRVVVIKEDNEQQIKRLNKYYNNGWIFVVQSVSNNCLYVTLVMSECWPPLPPFVDTGKHKQ